MVLYFFPWEANSVNQTALIDSLRAFDAPQILIQNFLSKADRLRSDFNPLVLIDPFNALLQRHLSNTRESH